MGDTGETDLIDAYAFPLPIGVISELLGVPQVDRPQVREWTSALVSDAQPEAIGQAGQAFGGYLTELIAAKRATPGQDLISDLLAASREGLVTDEEILNLTFILLAAGHETTVSLIGNAVHQLLRHPGQLSRLRGDPSLLPTAVEEVLRHSSPVHTGSLRFTTEPVTIAGVEIPANETIHISFLAANRDARLFPDPDRFDTARDSRHHLGFGHGIHFCVGAPLARMEGEVALRTLLERFPRLELAAQAADPQWRSSIVIHGLRTLPIRFGR
jgi:cytochrome P450